MRILLHSEAGVNRSAISPLLAFEQVASIEILDLVGS
jgi:hypothetical protein